MSDDFDFHSLDIDEMLDNSDERNAHEDFRSYTGNVRRYLKTLPPQHHGAILQFMRWPYDWRPYCFERNKSRWPDGRYYLLTRGYNIWLKRGIAFTREELTALGMDKWAHLCLIGHDDDWQPMHYDEMPTRHLPQYLELCMSITGALDDRRKRALKKGQAETA